MDESPRPEVAFLPFHQQERLAREDEEVLLIGLAVVHTRRLPGLEDADVDADLAELCVGTFEPGERSERAVLPARVAGIDDEPTVA